MSADSAEARFGAAPRSAGGVIHDIGYRRYEGERLSRGRIVLALCWHSLRSAFGIGRGIKAKIVPVLTFAIMCLPAAVDAVIVARTGTRQVSYDTYVPILRILVMTVFLAAQAPELVSRDLRSHVLPLYFARPISRLDYPLAKLTAFVLACLAMIEIPLLILYLGTIAQAHGGSAIWAQTRALIPGLLVGLMWSVLLASIAIAIASLTGRRAYATGGIAIFFLLTFTLARILVHVATQSAVVGPGPGPAGPKGGGPGGPPGGGSVPAHLIAPAVPAAAHLYALISPFTVLDGVRQWLGGTNPSGIQPGGIANPGSYGPLFGVMLLFFLGASLAILVSRYRKVGIA
jgi:ABC-2 type transport system permease protein